jgi:hypothetical protein
MNPNFMKPTNNLRFVMRVISSYKTEQGMTVERQRRILQQLWKSEPYDENSTVTSEWRDIPLEKA